jgi:hypothetical protein
MSYTAYANYVIYFSNPAEYAAAVALCGGNGYGHCPMSAATQFGIAWPLVTSPLQTKGMYGYAPYGIPASPGVGIEVNHPEPSGVYLTSDVDSVIVPGQVGHPTTVAGPDMQLVWWGVIVQVNAYAGGTPSATPIPPRKFIGGFELTGISGEGGSNNDTIGSKLSSRTGDGLGYPIRGSNVPSYTVKALNEFAVLTNSSWERFYVRVNALGTNDCGIWKGTNSAAPAAGAGIRISTTGAIQLVTINSGGADTLRATSSFNLTLGKWYLIDVLIKFPTAAADFGQARVFINHVLDMNYTDTSSGSLDTVGTHNSSRLGQYTVAETLWNIDLDDWMGADIPNIGGVESLDSVDWLMGTHIRASKVNSIVSAVNWANGSAETCNQIASPANVVTSTFVSTTALATIEAVTDLVDGQQYAGLVLGAASLYVGVCSAFPVGSANTRIGYKIAGGATVWTTRADGTQISWKGVLYNPSGLFTPASVVPLSILKEKSNDVTSTQVFAMGVAVEYIGQWGIEDEPHALDISNTNTTYLHNSRYLNTQYGTVLGRPTAPCYAIGGTYVGTGTTMHINLPAPAHFVWIRALTGTTENVQYFGASLGPHRGATERIIPNALTRAWIDSTGQAKISITGQHVASNAIGVVYQYIIFCDPGMRFNYCGAYNAVTALANVNIPLFDTNFLPQCGFIQKEVIGSATTTDFLTHKGVGNGALDGQVVTGTARANWGAFSAGNLNLRADNLLVIKNQYNFSLWRTTDPDCGDIAVQITSYVGDGLGFKVINLPLVTGRYPLFAMVIPQSGSLVTFMRDPSHTGVNSCNVIALTNSTTAIIGGGIDQLFVGAALDANLVKYEVFVIMGDSAGWSNGIFYLPDCISKGPWVAPTYVPPAVTDGGIELNGGATILTLQDVSGIYTLIPDKLTDTLYDRVTGQTNVDVAIPNPLFKTGYIGG